MSKKKNIWTNELSIGNASVDDDHKKLIEIINNLVDMIELGGSREEFAKNLSDMTDYALKHLKYEEIYMEEFAYPKLAEHKIAHREYVFKVAMYNVDLMGKNPPNPNEIIQYLEKWWTNHILIYDMDYENFKNAVKSDATYRIS